LVSRYQRRKFAASLKEQEYTGEKEIDMGENVQPKHRLGSRHQKREGGASIDVQEHWGGKKIDMGENIQPKHCQNR